MPTLTSFSYDADGALLSGVHGGPSTATTTAVLLHGAGRGSKARLLPLAEEFTAHGCRALAFDFSGHGESTGELGELTLRRRFEQAVGVIDAYVPDDGPLILVGFSMSGQTVADLVAHYGDRVTAIGLGAPAVYAADAWDEPFAEGDFTRIIRTPGSWRTSPALDTLRTYPGRALLLVPETDDVIPQEVTEAIEDALTANAQYSRVELDGADHQLGIWYRDHPQARRELVEALLTGHGWTATWEWLAKQTDKSVIKSTALKGGWTSRMRRVTLDDSDVVLRTFVKPFFRRHAPGLLTREARILTLLADQPAIPAARLIGVDADADHCDHPSLAMSLLPGRVRFEDEGADRRLDLLARLLADIHAVTPAERPRDYQAWTSADRVRVPEGELWERAVDVIRRDPPPYEGCFLHRDFHPGNVLFLGEGEELRVSGVVDWVETSWGPADLDVAHCSTALALLHGAEAGLGFRARYEAHGGRRLADGADHLYWRLLDCLAYAADASRLAAPWRESGRTDLTPELLGERLEAYVRGLLATYA
ncbi:alpha/beta fold hydrolase [Streptomyces sp. S6]